MGTQAERHLRWLAPRLTAVRELALVDWVCNSSASFLHPLQPNCRPLHASMLLSAAAHILLQPAAVKLPLHPNSCSSDGYVRVRTSMLMSQLAPQ